MNVTVVGILVGEAFSSSGESESIAGLGIRIRTPVNWTGTKERDGSIIGN